MRRKICWIIGCGVLCFALIIAPGAMINRLPTAAVCTPKQVVLQETVKARGVLEPETRALVKSPIPVCAERILVQVGEEVKKGQLLCTVDKKSTLMAYRVFLEQAGVRAEHTLAQIFSGLHSLPQSVQAVITAFLQTHSADPALLNSDLTAKEALSRLLALLPDAFYAPSDGCITAVHISYTDLSPIGSPLFCLGDEADIVAKLSVPEKEIGRIRAGQQVILHGVSFSGSITGTVTEISKTAQTPFSLTGAVPYFTVVVKPDKKDGLQPGCSVTASIRTGKKRQALLVPYETLRQVGRQESVTLYENGRFIEALVQTGTERADGVEVTEGLQTDSVLLLSDPNTLPPLFRIVEGES